jgi:hypothetical protein
MVCHVCCCDGSGSNSLTDTFTRTEITGNRVTVLYLRKRTTSLRQQLLEMTGNRVTVLYLRKQETRNRVTVLYIVKQETELQSSTSGRGPHRYDYSY